MESALVYWIQQYKIGVGKKPTIVWNKNSFGYEIEWKGDDTNTDE